ncbi:uncharacterized protein LOC129348233 [Amphiprion ocellaris]|uniref:uncharacterized protein LOC129348233 n=1 Tax=Amphiprion ocellaris TaxID=80972 RepID=UPI002410F4C3|nr:uncharacterized protein LOC129348233 [Amphiprion ocellaris]
MATSVYPGEDPQLRMANEKIANLLEDVRRLSAELRDKDALLARTMEVTHEQSMRIASLSAAFQDTAPWDPSCPRPSSCSTPNRQRSWTEVVIRGRQKTPVRAVSPPLSLSNRFMALSQIEERPAVFSAPAANGVPAASCSNGPAAPPPLLDTETAAHSAGSASPPVAVPYQQLSSRASTSASRRRLLEEAVRRRSGSLHCPATALDRRPGAESAAYHNGHHHPEPTELTSTRSGTAAGTRTSASPPAERPASALQRTDTRPAPAPLPARSPKVSAKRSPAPDGGVAGLSHRPPRPLFSPTTLIIGDSIVRNIRFFNATTRCFPGATAAGLLDKLPELLQSIPSSVCRVIIHIGTNDTTRRQSELMKQDFMDLFRLMESCAGTNFNKAFKTPSDALCENFADHFRTKIKDIRSSLLSLQVLPVNTPDLLSLPEETLESFALVDARTLGRVFFQVNPTTCLLDPIPTPLLKSFYGFFEEQFLNIINCSVQTGVFPTAFKTAVVKPLLKKSNLDPNVLNNYRPVSNLPFLSKILEKLAFNQVSDFLNRINILEKHQSGFRMNHSTETALLKILNDIRWNLDNKKLTVLVLLDLSAAFDTVDHHILLNRLKHLVGLSGTVFNWFDSYLTDRCFYVSMDTCSSGTHEIKCGVPQGSILGPILFNLYMLPLGDVIRRHGISFHSYADDTQLYIAVSPDDTGPIDSLLNCILDIKSWMAVNFLQLNQDKTEVLVIGPEGQREKLLSKLQDFKPANFVKNLGVIFDSELNFMPHIKNITRIGFYHLKSIARVRPFLSQASMEVLMHAFISSRLDYCNALLSGLPKKSILNLQLLQNSATRVLTRTRGREHITPVLKLLHWLPVRFRIDFKVLLLVFKCLNGLAPSYLSDLLLTYRPSRILRSSGSGLLSIPQARTKTHGEAAFSHYGPRLWNSLPENLRTAETVDIFKRRLKTHLFNQAFN